MSNTILQSETSLQLEINLQPEICTALVKKYNRGMITLSEMIQKLHTAETALADSKTSQKADIRAKQPLYSAMVINYQAAIAKVMKKRIY